MSAELEEALGRLAAVPPREFTKTRDALARSLKANGDAEGAAEIQGQKKPTAAQWALAALARENGKQLEALLGLGGKKGPGPREAAEQASALVAELRDAAAERLAGVGLKATPEVLRTVEATLRAAPLATAEERERLRRGRLDAAIGGDTSELLAASVARPAAKGRARPLARVDARESEKREKARARAEEKARRDAERLERAATKAEAAARKARAAAETAEKRAREAREHAADLEREAQAARVRADKAARSVPAADPVRPWPG